MNALYLHVYLRLVSLRKMKMGTLSDGVNVQGYMIRYLLSTLGRKEGFGDREDEDTDIPKDIDHGISIDSWIKNSLK